MRLQKLTINGIDFNRGFLKRMSPEETGLMIKHKLGLTKSYEPVIVRPAFPKYLKTELVSMPDGTIVRNRYGSDINSKNNADWNLLSSEDIKIK